MIEPALQRIGPSRGADLKDRLGLKQRGRIGEGVESMNVEFMLPGLEIDERERGDPVIAPLIEDHEEPSFLGVLDQVPMRGGEEIGRHTLHLAGENVAHVLAEGLRVIPLAPEGEGGSQPYLGEDLILVGDQLGEAVLAVLNGDDVG